MRVYPASIIIGLLVVCGCASEEPSGEKSRRLEPIVVTGAGGLVVCEDSIATEVGVAVLRAGGTAVDAAVATAFALAVTLPKAGNIGGGGFMLAYDPVDAVYWALDFRETAPKQAAADTYVKLARDGVADAATVGTTASGIPGTPAGLYAAWERGGYKDWRELVMPAVGLAVGGFTVGDTLAWDLERKAAALSRFEATRAIFLRDGRPVAAGETWVQPDLGAVLQAIADGGPAPFYRGAIAQRMTEAVQRAGGLWTVQDLEDYAPIFREPDRIKMTEDPPTVLITMPPPSSGSIVFAQTIALLRAQGALAMSVDDPARAARFVESLRLAFADRNRQLADPDQMNVEPAVMLSAEYLAARTQRLPAQLPGNSRTLAEVDSLLESGNTTHIVVMDGRGGVVSLTTTLNASFGSKFVVPGTGILLNNQMDDFDTRPGKPNLYGLVGTGVNKVRPGARMLSSMAPTIVERNGRPWIAIGARGGPRILTSVFQVIWHRVFDDMDLAAAITAPRLHHQWLPDRVYFERCCPSDRIRDALAAMGYRIDDKADLARVIAGERLPDGRFIGVVDARAGGLPKTVAE